MTAFLQYKKSYFSEKSLKFEILALFLIITYDVFGLECFLDVQKRSLGYRVLKAMERSSLRTGVLV